MKKIIFSCFIVMLLPGISCKKTENQSSDFLPLKITGLLPNSGNGGTLVRIQGAGFSSVLSEDTVRFNGMLAVVDSAGPGQLAAWAPAQGTTGPITVSVHGQTAQTGVYTYQALSVQGVSPAIGYISSKVTITGQGFTGYKGPPQVFFNSLDTAKVLDFNDQQLTVLVPANAVTGPVRVQANGQQGAGPLFTVLKTVTASPLTGGAGTPVTFKGSGFGTQSSQNKVTFNGVAATITSVTDTQLVALVPPGLLPTSAIVIYPAGGEGLRIGEFTIVPPPALTALSINGGYAGIPVTVYGAGFSISPQADSINLNGSMFPVDSATVTQVHFTVPTGSQFSSGPLAVSVNGQISNTLLFNIQGLTAFSIFPNVVNTNNLVYIKGKGFGSTVSAIQVNFGTASATVLSASDTILGVVVPAGTDSVSFTVQANGQSVTARNDYTVNTGILTIAGNGQQGIVTGFTTNAELTSATDLLPDNQGNIFIVDQYASNIRKIDPTGYVSVFAGDPNGNASTLDGKGAQAQFYYPQAITMDPQGNLYVVQNSGDNNSIRKIASDGTVTTIGTDQSYSAGGGTSMGIAYYQGSLLVVQYNDPNIYQISKLGVKNASSGTYGTTTVKVVLSNPNVSPNPRRITVDAAGNIYYTDASGFIGYKVQADGNFTVVGQGTLSDPQGIAADANGNLWVTDDNNGAVYETDPAGNFNSTPVIPNNGGSYPFLNGNANYLNNNKGIALDARAGIYIGAGPFVYKVVQAQ